MQNRHDWTYDIITEKFWRITNLKKYDVIQIKNFFLVDVSRFDQRFVRRVIVFLFFEVTKYSCSICYAVPLSIDVSACQVIVKITT